MIYSTDNYDELNSLSDYKVTKNFFNKVVVYKKNTETVGFLDYSVMYERAEINYIFVKEEYRNKNIASKLLTYMFDNVNVESTSLEVNINNKNAIKLYEKFSFVKVGLRKGYYNGEIGRASCRERV